jgi:Domain of unknown function (DUF4313)
MSIAIDPLCFNGTNWGYVEFDMCQYSNGRVAIMYTGEIERSSLTVNLPGQDLADGCVFVKDYDEVGTGILQAMVDAGLMERTGRTVRSGYVQIPEARLVGALKEEVDRLTPKGEGTPLWVVTEYYAYDGGGLVVGVFSTQGEAEEVLEAYKATQVPLEWRDTRYYVVTEVVLDKVMEA